MTNYPIALPPPPPSPLSSHPSSPGLNLNSPGIATPTNGLVNGQSRSTASVVTSPRNPIDSDARNLPLAPGMEDTLFAALKDLFWKISTHRKKTGVVAPVNFINKVKKENGKCAAGEISGRRGTWGSKLTPVLVSVLRTISVKHASGCA